MKPLAPSTRRRILDATSLDLHVARTTLDASLALIADSLAGHPQAARYDQTERSTRLWCFTHERDHRQCEHDGLTCGGTPVDTTDPTGDAATSPDPAAAAARKIDGTLVQLAALARVLVVEITAWAPPSNEMQHPDPSATTAPDGWCASCWRDDHAHQPITVRGVTSIPYYAGVCQWCGDFRARYKSLPPLAILRLRHQGRRITETVIEQHLPAGKKAS